MRVKIHKRTNRPGFTIVELLVVIIVISILAAISLVTFQGVQERARVTKNQAALSQYKKMIAVDGILNSSDAGAFTTTCLGQPTDYPQTVSFPAGACMVYGPDVPYIMHGPVVTSGDSYDAIHKEGRPTVDASDAVVDPDWISMRGMVLLTGSNSNGTRTGYMYKKPAEGCFGGDQLMTDAAAGGAGNPIGWWSMQDVCWSEIELESVF